MTNHNRGAVERQQTKMSIQDRLLAYFTSPLCLTFYATFTYFLFMYGVILSGLFDNVFTENGEKFYAEKAHPFFKQYFPMLKMPLNTLVNIGYLNVGLVIIAHTQKLMMNRKLDAYDASMFFVFGWGSFLYGHVQFWRIILQRQPEAVMDQWITLPIFAWTLVWTFHLLSGWSWLTITLLMTISSASYCLALACSIGFEIALAGHIFAALSAGVYMYNKFPLTRVKRAFWFAIVTCFGFVVLKLLDLNLPEYHNVFNTVTGHFLSKICDFLQIYFVAQFFLHINTVTNKYKLREKRE